ncbi:alpha-N-acetylglucosaminidase TIM-barrel domain-containing protein [Clostridium tarantellae]|uniref:Alpha-N-acetylglucosaminidase n=1 Tax=Clostridium tarantellae TaxID=39493 RepID=A0A6I1MPG2_9CLOT|nr:alpha-N-acetylglucosaminidase TIM-barrel domain-containing protein [Clostridium tarantellae]MPQ44683.1 hypothetical protein [Clostridium tarantellae]
MIKKRLKQLIAAALLFSLITPNSIKPLKALANTSKLSLNKDINIAEGKRAYGRDDHGEHLLSDAVDGDLNTYWDGGQFPSYLEVDLEKIYSLDSINIVNYEGENRYYNYSIYASTDGVNFDKIVEKNDTNKATTEGDTHELNKTVEARYLRVLMEYCSANEAAHISEFRVYGEETGKEGTLPKEINVPNFEDTEYAIPVSMEDTLNEVNGIVERRLGAQYKDWFDFSIKADENDLDYFQISNGDNGKIKIEGNNGVSLATGLNHYLKYFCKVQITEFGDPVKMPETAPKLDEPVRKETPYETRYAYNYCTFSYSMAFWDDDEWQIGLDWLALNGINLVLDLNAQDEVWRRFLTKLGYDITEIKNWLVGPGYMAWQYMGNMSTFGGPLPDQWFEARTELARKMQRKMKSLGMETVLQGYSGMVPNDIKEKRPNLDIIPQGQWCSFDRPAMLKTDSADYEEFAKLYYESQEEVYGKDATNYYATDPFHEGGTDAGMSRATIYKETLDSMLEYDKDAVWVIQSWRENPAQEGLNGITPERRDNLLVLDLYAELDPRWIGRSNIWGYQWDAPEFDGTPWVWNMLNNFGGRMGIHGQLEVLATEIPKAYKTTSQGKESKMKGIGMTPEALGSNPVLFDLLFEMAWTEDEVNVDEWLKDYIERRYGKYTDNAYKAWQVFNETAYAKRTGYHEGATESVINARPRFDANSAALVGSTTVTYNKIQFEEAVKLLLADYEELKDNPGYLFDLADFLRQVLANSSQEYYKKFTSLYKANDKDGFEEYANKFLELIKLQEKILSTQDSLLLGNWIQDAKDVAFDEFSTDMFELNARALLTTWGGLKQSEDGGLRDYSNRQWSGLTGDFYYKRWELWINSLKEAMATGTQPENIDWFEFDWQWVLDDKEYTTETSNFSLKELGTEAFDKFAVSEITKPDPLAIPQYEMKATASSFEPIDKPENVLDSNTDTIWHTKYSNGQDQLPQSITLNLGKEYNINKFSYLPRQVGTNGHITKYILETSINGVDFTTVKEGILENNSAEKLILFDETKATHVRFTAVEGAGGFASASELNVFKVSNEIDKTKLKELIDNALNLDENNYTEESFNNLTKYLDEAKTVFENENATEEEVILAKNNLQNAIDSLVLKEIKLEKIKNITANPSNNSIELSWEKPNSTIELVEYVVYKDGKEYSKIPANETTALITDLKSNYLYNFKIVVKYSNGKQSRPISINARTLK